MIAAVYFSHGATEPHAGPQWQVQEATVTDMVAFREELLARANLGGWGPGRGEGGTLTLAAEAILFEPDDVVFLYTREGNEEPVLDILMGGSPTRDQLITAAVVVDEVGRGLVRRLLAQHHHQQQAEAAVREQLLSGMQGQGRHPGDIGIGRA